MSAPTNDPEASKNLLLAFISIILLWGGCTIWKECDGGNNELPDYSSGGGTYTAPAREAYKPRAERLKDCFSAWDGAHKNLEKWVKAQMNDPDSYDHVETRYDDSGDTVLLYMKFRGKNAFGGVVLNSVAAQCGADCDLIGEPVMFAQ